MIGGGSSAVGEALYLAGVAESVKIIVRSGVKASSEYAGKLEAAGVEVLDGEPEEIIGQEGRVAGVKIGGEVIDCDGVFVYIGQQLATGWLKGILELDETGAIVAKDGTNMTSMPGVFVAGDCKAGAVRQVVTAVADGAVAAIVAGKWLADYK